MKKLFATLAVLLAIFAFSSSQSVYADTIATYTSGFQIQNLDQGADAAIVVTYYNPDGSTEPAVNDSIPANGSKTYFPLGVRAGFSGSAVISSDKPVAAIANVIGDGTQGSSYSGFDEGSSTVSLPIINKSFFNIDTWFNVQNANTTGDVDVTVSYSGSSCTETATVKPGAAHTFDQALNTCLPNAYVGAATVTTGNSSDRIVASALQVGPGGLFAYNGFAQGGTNPSMPLVSSNNFGFQTGIQIQNQGATASSVTLTFTPSPGGGNGTACTETLMIDPGDSSTFVLNAFTFAPQTSGTTCTLGEKFVGSASVTGNSASMPLVAVVNQTDFAARGSAYNGFDPAQATDTLVMPLIMDGFGIWTGYNVVNVGTSATVTCDYGDQAASVNDSATLATGEALNAVQINKVSSGWAPNSGSAYVGSAVCTATAGGKLLGVVNQAAYAAGSSDSTLTYEAFNQ